MPQLLRYLARARIVVGDEVGQSADPIKAVPGFNNVIIHFQLLLPNICTWGQLSFRVWVQDGAITTLQLKILEKLPPLSFL